MAQLYSEQQAINAKTVASEVILAGGSDLQTYINNGGGGGGSTPSPSRTYSRYAAIGDSITYGSHAGSHSYADDISTFLGVSTYNKLAQSGKSILDNTSTDYLGQCSDVNASTDLITIMMGTNDFHTIHGDSSLLGEVTTVMALEYTHDSSKTPYAAYTDAIALNSAWSSLLGKFRFGLEYLKNKCPNARIIVIPPIYNKATSTSTETTRNNVRDGEYLISLHCGVEVFYITRVEGGIFNSTLFDPYMDDATHPNRLGQDILGRRIYHYVVYGS